MTPRSLLQARILDPAGVVAPMLEDNVSRKLLALMLQWMDGILHHLKLFITNIPEGIGIQGASPYSS